MNINIPLCLLSLCTLQGFGSSVLASEKIAYIFIINHNITQPTWPVAFMQEHKGSPKRKVTERELCGWHPVSVELLSQHLFP